MRIRIATTLLCVLIFAGMCRIAAAQAAPDIIVSPDVVPPPPACEAPEPVTFLLEAQTLTLRGPVYLANGNVLFQKGAQRLNASSAWYNADTGVGVINDAVYTTCTSPHPDYRIKAKEVTVLPDRRVHFRNPAVYLGNFRVLMLPSLKLRVGGNQSTSNIFPRPGFDKEDGLTLSQDLRLIDDDNLHLEADIRLTTSGGIQGEFDTIYGIGGNLSRFPGRFLTYNSMRESVITLPKRPVGEPCSPEELRPINASRLRAHGIFSLKQRTYDIKDEGLVVYRQPELNLDYIGRQINLTGVRLDPRLEMYPQLFALWGRFKESPGNTGFIMKSELMATIPFNVFPINPRTSIQPVVQQSYSWYDNGDTYHTWAYALDATHMFPNDSLVDLRYIKRNDSGVTPFEFDNVDIREEVQAGFQAYMQRHTVGFVASYDLGNHSLYDWEIMYGYRTDCLATWFRWNNRLSKFSMDVMVISK